MVQGKKTSVENIYKVMVSWATTGNYAETARTLNMPATTVEKIVKDNKEKPEFANLIAEKRAEFSERASRIIDQGMLLLERRFNRAIECEADLDILIDEIFATEKDELSQDEKQRLITKIRALELHDIRAITTAIGTLYDKKALADGKPTDRVAVVGDETLEVMAKLAGYERKQ